MSENYPKEPRSWEMPTTAKTSGIVKRDCHDASSVVSDRLPATAHCPTVHCDDHGSSRPPSLNEQSTNYYVDQTVTQNESTTTSSINSSVRSLIKETGISGHDCSYNNVQPTLSTATDKPGWVRSTQRHPHSPLAAHPYKKQYCLDPNELPCASEPETIATRSGTRLDENRTVLSLPTPDTRAYHETHVPSHMQLQQPSSNGIDHDEVGRGFLGDNNNTKGNQQHQLSLVQLLGGVFPSGHGMIRVSNASEKLQEEDMVVPLLLEHDTPSIFVSPRVTDENPPPNGTIASSTRDDDDDIVQQTLTVPRAVTNEDETNGDERRPPAPATTTPALVAQRMDGRRRKWNGPQKATDVIFGMNRWHGTIRCEEIVQTFSRNREAYPEWDDAMAEDIQTKLGTVALLVYVDDTTDMPCETIGNAKLCQATEEEFVSHIKAMFDKQRGL